MASWKVMMVSSTAGVTSEGAAEAYDEERDWNQRKGNCGSGEAGKQQC